MPVPRGRHYATGSARAAQCQASQPHEAHHHHTSADSIVQRCPYVRHSSTARHDCQTGAGTRFLSSMCRQFWIQILQLSQPAPAVRGRCSWLHLTEKCMIQSFVLATSILWLVVERAVQFWENCWACAFIFHALVASQTAASAITLLINTLSHFLFPVVVAVLNCTSRQKCLQTINVTEAFLQQVNLPAPSRPARAACRPASAWPPE
jgi:hypothetical protein